MKLSGNPNVEKDEDLMFLPYTGLSDIPYHTA